MEPALPKLEQDAAFHGLKMFPTSSASHAASEAVAFGVMLLFPCEVMQEAARAGVNVLPVRPLHALASLAEFAITLSVPCAVVHEAFDAGVNTLPVMPVHLLLSRDAPVRLLGRPVVISVQLLGVFGANALPVSPMHVFLSCFDSNPRSLHPDML